MTTCRSCGAENPEDSKFCTTCGAGLASRAGSATAGETVCPGCGGANTADSKFCIACGRPLEVQQPAGPAFCTGCGAALDPGSRFCTGCGAAVGAAPGPSAEPASGPSNSPGRPSGSGLESALAAYWAAFDARLAQNGFETFDKAAVLSVDRVLRRKRFELGKAGHVTTFCAVKWSSEELTEAFVRGFSQNIFNFANGNKGYFARNAFQPLVVYPVIVAASCPPEVETFLNSHWPKHWMAYEFPVVVSLAPKNVFYHRPTPVWGMAFHAGFKREAETLFQP